MVLEFYLTNQVFIAELAAKAGCDSSFKNHFLFTRITDTNFDQIDECHDKILMSAFPANIWHSDNIVFML